MFAHGIMTALAFSLIGFFYDQTHTRMLDDLGGLMKAMPFVGTLLRDHDDGLGGPPGLRELRQRADGDPRRLESTTIWSKVPAILAIWGLVVTGVYLLRTVKDAFFGDDARPLGRTSTDARTPIRAHALRVLVGRAARLRLLARSRMLDVIRQGTSPIVQRLGVRERRAREGRAALRRPAAGRRRKPRRAGGGTGSRDGR